MVFVAALVVVGCNNAAPSSQGNAQAQDESEHRGKGMPNTPLENPFTRPAVEPRKPQCTTVALEVADELALSGVLVENHCDYAVALLTSPIEVRVRRSGNETFVHERMPWTAYALLYVVSAELGSDAFRGDGVVRDGGSRVRRDPGYVTIPARATVKVPMRCVVNVPRGRYVASLMSYEAPQGEAPLKADAFDCGSTVASYNEGFEAAANISLGGDVREVRSTSARLLVRP